MTDANGPTRVCRNPGCSGERRDEFDGCCSAICAVENAQVGASTRDPRRDAERASQSDESGRGA